MSTITTMPVSMEGWQEEQQSWNQTSKFFVNMHEREDRVAQVVDFVARLKELDIHPAEGETALDVGCGTADYAMGLARNGVKVTGVDLSTGMLEGGKAISEKEGLSLDLWLGPWSEEARQALGWGKQFDLVYSIFCPIMSDTANLRALHKASRKHCLCIMFADRKDEYLDAIYSELYGVEGSPWKAMLQDCVDTAHDIGNHVQVTYKTVEEVENLTVEAAVDYFCLRVHRKVGGDLEAVKDDIRQYLASKAVNGTIDNHTTDTIAWISWDV